MLLRFLKKVYHKVNALGDLNRIKLFLNREYRLRKNSGKRTLDFVNQDSSNYIYEKLASDEPVMISRFGSVELNGICRCLARREKNRIKKLLDYFLDKTDYFDCNSQMYDELINNAGFFSANNKSIEDFTDLYLNAMGNIDILGSWLCEEKYIRKYCNQNMKKVSIGALEPWWFDKPAWSRVLKGKKILVVHPFEKTIKQQYKIRDKLFDNPDILPDFKLITLKAVQSIAGETVPYDTWFDALQSMEEKIKSIDFDIAIIGCGAYGMPLASFVKTMGKKAVHLGGATQLLFGIKGKRWEGMDEFKRLFNEYWISPLPDDTPNHFKRVESGCYW